MRSAKDFSQGTENNNQRGFARAAGRKNYIVFCLHPVESGLFNTLVIILNFYIFFLKQTTERVEILMYIKGGVI